MGKHGKRKYEAYANSAFKFYVRHENGAILLPSVANVHGENSAKINIANWTACHEIVQSLCPIERCALCDIYRDDGPMPDIVTRVAHEYQMPINRLWLLLTKATRTFATVRGLDCYGDD